MKKEFDIKSEKTFLESYDASSYEKPSVAADIVLFTVSEAENNNYRKLPEKELLVLLINRSIHPFKGCWALPGGFVRPDETVEQTAERKLKEETGVDCGYLEQLYVFSNPERDPRTRVITSAHMALIDKAKLNIAIGDGAADAAWFKISVREKDENVVFAFSCGSIELSAKIIKGKKPSDYVAEDNKGIAFDHAAIIYYALERLRGKLDYTDIAFHLLPEQFTLTELQQIYELILGEKLLAPAFRRKISPGVQETGSFRTEAGHRPSQLFRLKNDKKNKL